MQHVSGYVYRPLQRHGTVRILVLYPSVDFQAPLEACFEHDDQELSQNNTTSSAGFDAVSYCWGEPNFTHKISIHSGSHGCTTSLAITKNVDSMLRHLRKPYKERRLWIDAICINQADIEEKNVQVRLMGNIYTAALKVHVWLGAGGTFDAQAAFTHLKRVVVTDELKCDSFFKPARLSGNYEPTKAALQQLFANPWFVRRWILQEVALGHDITVHYGNHKIAWHWFSKGIMLLPEADVQISILGQWESYQPYVAAAKVISVSLNDTPDLPHLLLTHASAQCYDQRDRLFALYGILSRNSKFSRSTLGEGEVLGALTLKITDLEVNYTKSWVEIYQGLAELLLRFHETDFWLHLWTFGSIGESEPGAPSWVPDWRQKDISILPRSFRPGTVGAMLFGMSRYIGLYSSGWYCGTVTMVWDVSPQSRLNPYYIARGIRSKNNWHFDNLASQMYERLKWNLAGLLILAANTIDQEHRVAHGLTRYWWTVLRMQTLEVSSIQNFKGVRNEIRDWLGVSRNPFGYNSPDSVSSLVNSVLRRNKVFRIMRQNREHGIFYEGLGITSGQVELGDVIFRCSLPGAAETWEPEDDLLLILRPTRHEELPDPFRLVGFCFMSQDWMPRAPKLWEAFPREDAMIV